MLIVNQPYLVGWRDGVVYLEAHTPFQESGTANWKRVYSKLKNIEQQSESPLDWKKVRTVVLEARGIPVPVSVNRESCQHGCCATDQTQAPGTILRPTGNTGLPYGRTGMFWQPACRNKPKPGGWRAIINHQGPPIPARVLSEGDRHRVLAGPFDNRRAAKDAARRLKIDLELDAVLFK